MPKRLISGPVFVVILLSVAAISYLLERRQTQHAPQRAGAQPTVASITPAGTDLVIGIGAADHLVAVCDLDEDRPGTTGLPRVGDFDHVDWEKLSAAGPKILITQFGGRMPAGLKERCDELGITLIDIRLNVIDDVYREAATLGAALGEPEKAAKAIDELKERLAALQKQMANAPPVRVAIAVSDGSAIGLIGPGTFHDQLLTIVGGVNVASKFDKPYIAVDREQLTALAPEVIFDLEPVPPTTPQQLAAAKQFWNSLPDLPAVKNGRVMTITVPYCLRPGWHLTDLAEVFADRLKESRLR
jgi:iron complex transport system substrate-binding protein